MKTRLLRACDIYDFCAFAWMKIIWWVKCKFQRTIPKCCECEWIRKIAENHMSIAIQSKHVYHFLLIFFVGRADVSLWKSLKFAVDSHFFSFHFDEGKLIFRTSKWAKYKSMDFVTRGMVAQMPNKRLKLFEQRKSHFLSLSDRFSNNWSGICYL